MRKFSLFSQCLIAFSLSACGKNVKIPTPTKETCSVDYLYHHPYLEKLVYTNATPEARSFRAACAQINNTN